MSSDQTSGKDTTAMMPKEKENHQDRKLKPPPPDHHVKCPRCDSPNTKFCYYNNYSLSQPRHFCKTCRRYWTKGGALRNVPIGGGCRKNKRMKQRLAEITNSRDSSSCEIMGSATNVGLNFFQGFLTPAMDFQLGGSSINPQSSSSMFNPSADVDTNFSLYDPPHRNAAQVNSSSYNPSSGAVANFMGFDYLRSGGGGDPHHVLDGITQQIGTSTTSNNNSMIVHSNLASSIESLSSINQELHWKLQQQRLAVLLSESHQPENQTTDRFDYHDHHHQTRTQNFLPQQPKEADPYSTGEARTVGGEIPAGKSRLAAGENIIGVNGSSTEWFFDVSPYANARRGLADHEGDKITDQTADGNDNQNNNWNTGIQAWRDLQQYNGALP